MKEKIIVLGNGEEWCEKSLKDFLQFDNVKINNCKYLKKLNSFTKILAKIHFSYKINKKINLPLKKLWYNKIIEYVEAKKDEKVIFIVYDRNGFANDLKFIKYLRNNFKNCKLVYMFSNIVEKSGAIENNFVSKLNEYYDVVYAFDKEDSKKYNFKYSPLLYSANKINVNNKNQVFYVGKAKDRYELLIKIYEKLKELNINTKFHIFGVDKESQVYNDNIEYNKYISYDECLRNIQESNCLVDVIQGNSTGFTIKVCEAICYDKLLITNNKHVKETPFYDSRFILVINSESDIKREFFENANNVKYSKEGKAYFSVNTYLKKLYNDLDMNRMKGGA